MRIAAFRVDGRVSLGVVRGDRIADVGAAAPAWTDLVSLLRCGDLERFKRTSREAPERPLAEVELLKPVDKPEKILCVGVNYRDRPGEYRDGAEAPRYPSLFVRFPDSFVAQGAPIVRPRESRELDYEGEIAVVIGRPGRRIAEVPANDHIAGLPAANDGSVRDWVRHGKFNVTPGKNFDRSGALGPWLTTADEVGDEPIRVRTLVNGELRQDGATHQMVFPIPSLIAYISSFCTLQPGDVILTGTPVGAGARFAPPRYLAAGDRIEVEVSRVGTLANTVADDE